MLASSLLAPYQRFIIEPLLRLTFIKKRKPASLTLTALIFGIITLPLIAFNYPYLAIGTLLISGFFDTLDGSLARHLNMISNRGALFDIFSDRIVELSVVMGLFLYDPIPRALTSLLMVGSILLCVTSLLIVGIFKENEKNSTSHQPPGIIERAEAFVFFLAMILFPKYFFILSTLFSLLMLSLAPIRLIKFLKAK
ncbi:MAG: CDP-alcohol phosphatidyltransferase family protein [Simkaniaceae bacterium]